MCWTGLSGKRIVMADIRRVSMRHFAASSIGECLRPVSRRVIALFAALLMRNNH